MGKLHLPTARNLEVLQAIRTLEKQTRFTPTCRELGAHLYISSSSTVYEHLRRLEVAGLIERRGSRMRVTDEGGALLSQLPGADVPDTAVPPDLRDELLSLARAQGITVKVLIVDALAAYIAEYNRRAA